MLLDTIRETSRQTPDTGNHIKLGEKYQTMHHRSRLAWKTPKEDNLKGFPGKCLSLKFNRVLRCFGFIKR